jgi:hypothetical protein
MLYYSYDVYMSWYNWYYGIKSEEEIIVEKTPHDFPSCNFQLNEAIIASINDPPPPPPLKVCFAEKQICYLIKPRNKKKKKHKK